MTPRIYVASKMKHAEMWRRLYETPRIHIVSRWPFLEPFISPGAENAKFFWQDDIADLRACHACLVYAEPGEHLRGALVEAGAALAMGKLVVVVGDHPDYGTWQYHPNVAVASSIADAFDLIRQRVNL